MAYQTLTVEIDDYVALIRLARPEALNALNSQLVGELAEPGPSEEALHRAQEIAGDHGVPEGLIFLDVASDVPISADDEPPLVVLSNGQSRPLHEVSFLLGRLFNATFTRVRLVFPAELREPMRRAFGS